MNLQRAALLAAIGVLLRGLHYWVANLIPSWNSSGVMDQIAVAQVAIVDPLVWTFYFGAVWRGAPSRLAAWLAAVLGVAEIAFVVYRQWELLSFASLDSIALLLGAVLPVFFWGLYLLLNVRVGLWYVLLFGLTQLAAFAYQMVTSWPEVQQYWREEPWQLLAAPLIWATYWVTQTLFVRAAQKDRKSTRLNSSH